MQHRIAYTLTIAAAAATIAGCSTPTGTPAGTPTSPSDPTAPAPAAKPSGAEVYATPTATPEPTSDVLAFGVVGQWEDGLTATVKTVQRFRFGQYATTPGPGVKITVQVVNGSAAAVDLFPTVDVRLGVDGTNAEQVYTDGCDGLADVGRLAAGRTVTATLCFTGTAPQVDVSLAPTFDYAALTWTGKVTASA